jgi:predicted Zn-dependent protease
MSPSDIAEQTLAAVGDDANAEAVVTAGRTALTRFANSFIHQNITQDTANVELRVEVDGRVSSSSATAADPDALTRLARTTVESARLQPVDEEWPGLTEPVEVPAVDHYDEETAASTPDQRATMVGDFIDTGERAAGYLATEGATVVYANTNGHSAEGRFTRAILDGIHQTPSSAGSAHAASARIADIDAEAAGAIALDRAQRASGAFDLKPGEYEVVLSPECVGTILIFLAVYGFNARAHQEGQSCLRLGEQQFHQRVNIFDDATDPRALGVGFDLEGTPKSRVEFVSAGVSSALAHNRRTAGKAGVASTGHAIPFPFPIGPVPINLFLEGGDEPVEDMIASVERGLYVSTFNYCRVLDPKTLAVTGLTRNGTFMIENGRITGAVTNLRFTQSFVAALQNVEGIGNDGRFADSEFGPGFVHVPSLRLASWNFTGGASG